MDNEIVIGIDLGTTNSCVSVFMNNKLKILENKEGGRVTPSYIFFADQPNPIVGQYAKRMGDMKPEYGVYEIKRLVGRKFDDPYVKNNLANLPFLVKNISNEPVVIIQGKNQIIKKTSQELCSHVLHKLKNDTEAKLMQPISKAVITVPAYFNITQREVTLAAAKQAGFTVLKLLNEPTAAALSYYYEYGCDDDGSYSLVYDLGGGTFDVAILSRKDSEVNIIAVDGDTHLGGHDFNNILVDHVCQILIDKYKFNPRTNRRHMRRMNNECEEAKKILSFSEETSIMLIAFLDSQESVEIPITKKKFEELASHLFDRTLAIVERCLVAAGLAKDDIKEVILCGGSTRIPKIQSMICDYFNGKQLNKFINPDECVAEGAAIQAAMLSKGLSQKISNIKVTDVTPLSLGISNFVDSMTFMIKRNTPIPTSGTANRVTVYDNQSSMTFAIFEGERANAKKNHFLGHLEITDLTPAPPLQCAVSVIMSIDQNGILTISATETVSNRTKDLKIVYTIGQRSDSEIKSVVVDAAENAKEDQEFCRFAAAKGYLIKYCVRAVYNIEQKNLTQSCKTAYKRCVDVRNQLRDLDIDDEKEVIALREEIIALCAPLVEKYNFTLMP